MRSIRQTDDLETPVSSLTLRTLAWGSRANSDKICVSKSSSKTGALCRVDVKLPIRRSVSKARRIVTELGRLLGAIVA